MQFGGNYVKGAENKGENLKKKELKGILEEKWNVKDDKHAIKRI
jgi:hypothetical protein